MVFLISLLLLLMLYFLRVVVTYGGGRAFFDASVSPMTVERRDRVVPLPARQRFFCTCRFGMPDGTVAGVRILHRSLTACP